MKMTRRFSFIPVLAAAALLLAAAILLAGIGAGSRALSVPAEPRASSLSEDFPPPADAD